MARVCGIQAQAMPWFSMGALSGSTKYFAPELNNSNDDGTTEPILERKQAKMRDTSTGAEDSGENSKLPEKGDAQTELRSQKILPEPFKKVRKIGYYPI